MDYPEEQNIYSKTYKENNLSKTQNVLICFEISHGICGKNIKLKY